MENKKLRNTIDEVLEQHGVYDFVAPRMCFNGNYQFNNAVEQADLGDKDAQISILNYVGKLARYKSDKIVKSTENETSLPHEWTGIHPISAFQDLYSIMPNDLKNKLKSRQRK